MAILKQSPTAFAKYLVWYGSCDEVNQSTAQYEFLEVKTNFDIRVFEKSLSISNVPEILQIIEYTQSGTGVRIFDKNSNIKFWDFTSLRVGHLYQITLSKGNSQIELPNLHFYNDSNQVGYVTSNCFIEPTPTPEQTPTPTPEQTPTPTPEQTPTPTPEQTPTPTPEKTPTPTPFNCCTNTSLKVNEDMSGVSFQHENSDNLGGSICFESLTSENISTDSILYYCFDSQNNYICTINISSANGIEDYAGDSTSAFGVFYYVTSDGNCLRGDLSTGTPFDYANPVIFE